MMQKNLNIPVLGPEEPAISRIRNEYLRTIIIKNSSKYFRYKHKKLSKKYWISFDAVAQYRAIVIVNVDFTKTRLSEW
jgi:primosomal protein N' (replication factor Y)